jgi:hypothetical protein
VLSEAELAGTTAGLVVTLATGTPAVQTRAPGPRRRRILAPAPPAARVPRRI